MIQVMTEWGLYVFDGQVLEIFLPNGKSQRVHVLFIKEAKLERNRKGQLELWIDLSHKSFQTPPSLVADENLSQAQAFLEAVNKARN